MKSFQPSLTIPAAALCALILCACGNQADAPKQRQNSSVVVLKAHTLLLSDHVEALGTAQADESITITARIAGRLEEVNFSDGQQVKKGDVIARMDQDEEQAQLVAAGVQLVEHQREIKRLESLLARKAAAARDLDLRKTQAALTASTIKEIKARISELTLRAPFAGRLGIRRVSPGAMIQPGTVITTLDAAEKIKLDFTVASTELDGLTTGMAVEASCDALPGELFSGKLTGMDSRIDPLTRSMLLRAEIDNKDGKLVPGMLMRVVLKSHERESLVVPEESVTQKQKQHFLTLVGADGRVELRAVETGLRRHGVVEIVHGLAAGELVMVRGMGFAKAGQTVSISETWDSIRDHQYSISDELR
ncbi:MAG: hypothetical protein AUJ57_09840 [Zetaproteobacteria bacterium CG1_02_53_45]|nr:MAG: hypothetical protein AUJ57_09840 [Zetaproteobacteria bacterium CG1_02_53_45]